MEKKNLLGELAARIAQVADKIEAANRELRTARESIQFQAANRRASY